MRNGIYKYKIAPHRCAVHRPVRLSRDSNFNRLASQNTDPFTARLARGIEVTGAEAGPLVSSGHVEPGDVFERAYVDICLRHIPRAYRAGLNAGIYIYRMWSFGASPWRFRRLYDRINRPTLFSRNFSSLHPCPLHASAIGLLARFPIASSTFMSCAIAALYFAPLIVSCTG